MNKTILCTGAVLGLLAVVVGAFGAHGLKELINADALQTFETGVKIPNVSCVIALVCRRNNLC